MSGASSRDRRSNRRRDSLRLKSFCILILHETPPVRVTRLSRLRFDSFGTLRRGPKVVKRSKLKSAPLSQAIRVAQPVLVAVQYAHALNQY